MKTTLSKPCSMKSLATVSAALAATAAPLQAATVQITLYGNMIDSSGNTLYADLTGDGTNDITFQSPINNGFFFNSVGINNAGRINATVGPVMTETSLGGPDFRALYRVRARFTSGGTQGVGVQQKTSFSPQNIKYLNLINFSDARINGGVSTRGYLEVNAFNSSISNQTVALTRLVFDDASTTLGTSGLSTGTNYTEWVAPAGVPEPSSFGLLALGAGGLLARRRRPAA